MSVDSPKISVIVPVYNAMPYLKETLDALKNQTWHDFEALLIDDGSTDESAQVCDRFAEADERFKVFHCANSGVSRSRNLGLDQATGQYIVFCDSDDTYEERSLELMLGVMERYNADLVIAGYCRVFSAPQMPRKDCCLSRFSLVLMQSAAELATVFLRPGTNLFGISIWTKMYRAGIIEQNGIRFPEDVDYEEDCCFNLLYFRHVRMAAAINDILYRYRQREISLSKGYRAESYPFLVNGFRKRLAFITELGLEEKSMELLTVFLMAIIMTYQKISESGLTREQRLKEYRSMFVFPESKEACRVGLQSPRRLVRWVSKATLSENPERIERIFRLRRAWVCLKEPLQRIKDKLTGGA